MTDKKEIGQSTKSIWGGEQEYELYERSTQVPVVHSVSFGYKDIDTWHKAALGVVEGHIYSRNTNPTVRAFEDKVKELISGTTHKFIPVGRAFKLFNFKHSQFNLLLEDNKHPNPNGSYLASCVIFSHLSGLSSLNPSKPCFAGIDAITGIITVSNEGTSIKAPIPLANKIV